MLAENRFQKARTEYNQHGQQSVKDVSKATGITASLIEDLELDSYNRAVGYQKIKVLAKYYGVTSDYLLGLSGVPTQDKNIQNASQCTGLSLDAIYFFEDLKDLPAEKKERILFAVNTLLSESRFDESVLFWEHIAKYLATEGKFNLLLDGVPDVLEADEVLEILLTQNNKYLHKLRAELIKANNAKKKSRIPKKGGGNTGKGVLENE